MAMPLSIAKSLGKSKAKKSKVISEYGGKASPIKKKPFNGATNRLRRKKSGR
jgi:hypothetical protein